MKRKLQPKPDAVVPAEILAQVQSVLGERLKKADKCAVCGAETSAVASAESLCWVCRRLKISAWREIEQQMPLQE